MSKRSIFINLAVRDLAKSKEFFSKLGFEFNMQFTDENAACMIINEHAYVMLLQEAWFKTFTKREICDTSKQTEGLFAFDVSSREEVDRIVSKAIEMGGKPAIGSQDHGFMYFNTFYDLDGHQWEVLWMDPSALAPQ